jgi:hypothetical protein
MIYELFYKSVFEEDFLKEIEKIRKSSSSKERQVLERNKQKKKEYSKNFGPGFKKRIKKRDNYQCQLCMNKEKLTIHHIDYNKKHTRDDNVITLCHTCNLRVNGNRKHWEEHFKKLLHYKILRKET